MKKNLMTCGIQQTTIYYNLVDFYGHFCSVLNLQGCKKRNETKLT